MQLQPLRGLLRRPPAGSGDFSRYIDRFIGGNRLSLLSRGGDVFKAMWEAMDSARETIHLE